MVVGPAGLLAGGLFTGGALFVSVVTHPDWMGMDPAQARAAFARSYRRAAVLQGGLAVVAAALSGIAWGTGERGGFAIASLLFASIVLFTVAAFPPVIAPLLREDPPAEADEVQAALRRFGWLHGVRVVLGLAGFALLVRALYV